MGRNSPNEYVYMESGRIINQRWFHFRERERRSELLDVYRGNALALKTAIIELRTIEELCMFIYIAATQA